MDPEDPKPLDPSDPRLDAPVQEHPRRLVRHRDPGPDLEDRQVRVLRRAFPALAVAGAVVVGAVFFMGLSPGSSVWTVGPEAAVRAALEDRPRRVCYRGTNPCAWLALVDGRVLAFNTNGPLPEEFGRQGVGWCPSSGYYGANATGSRWDALGHVVRGPAYRGLDRFGLSVRPDGTLVVNFASLTAGRQESQRAELVPPAGEDCDPVPFDRAPDLDLPA